MDIKRREGNEKVSFELVLHFLLKLKLSLVSLSTRIEAGTYGRGLPLSVGENDIDEVLSRRDGSDSLDSRHAERERGRGGGREGVDCRGREKRWRAGKVGVLERKDRVESGIKVWRGKGSGRTCRKRR